MTLNSALNPNAVLHEALIAKYRSEMFNKMCGHGLSQNELEAYIKAIANDAVNYAEGFFTEPKK